MFYNLKNHTVLTIFILSQTRNHYFEIEISDKKKKLSHNQKYFLSKNSLRFRQSQTVFGLKNHHDLSPSAVRMQFTFGYDVFISQLALFFEEIIKWRESIHHKCATKVIYLFYLVKNSNFSLRKHVRLSQKNI